MGERRCYGCMKPKQNERICPHCGHDERQQNGENQLPIGTILKDQYVIGKVLGQGGFGITYMGWDMYLDIPVAIKEYYPNGSVMRNSRESTDVISYGGETGERFLHNKERFMKEVKMLARFSDVPEIVQVKTFFLANNTAYIVMEYIEGITLKDYVRRQGGRLDAATTFGLLKPVMEALSKVHKTGLVHRDISPDNIMLTGTGVVKLLDFGAVRDVTAPGQDKSTEAIFKQGYAPIEQYRGRNIGPWTDVYAFCATIYFCLTGQVPPDAPELLMGEQLPKLTALNCGVTAEMENVLKKGMASRAEDRIQDMGTLCSLLFPDHGAAQKKGRQDREEEQRAEKERMEKERAERERAERERIEKERAEKKRTEKERTEKERAEKERAERERAERKRAEKERIEKERAEKEGARQEHAGQRQGNQIQKDKLVLGATVSVMAVLLAAAWWKSANVSTSQLPETQSVQQESAEDQEAQTEALPAQFLEGQCGDNVYWSLDTGTGVLNLQGEGPTWRYGNMDAEYAQENGLVDYEAPFYPYKDSIKELIVEPGITVLGSHLMKDCTNLKNVDWGTIDTIQDCCFMDSGLVRVELPETVRYIYDYAFHYCLELEEVILPESLVAVSFPFSATESMETVVFKGDPFIFGQYGSGGSIFYERENMHGSRDVVIYCEEDSLNVKAYAQQNGEAYVIIKE